MDDGDAVAEFLHDFENVRGEKDGHSGPDQRPEKVLDQPRGHRIDALEGLVEKEELRFVDQSRTERQFLFHPVAEIDDLFPALAGEVHQLQQFLASGPDHLFPHPEHPADKIEILPWFEPIIEGQLLGQDTDPLLHLHRLPGHVEADLQQSGEHFDGGGFAGTVGAEKTEE